MACCGGSKITAIQVIKAYWNSLAGKNKAISIERMKICNGCDKNKLGICSECGCVLKAKTTLSNAKCPLGKW